MRLILLLTAFSFLAACNSIPRPDTDICQVNVEAMHKKCFNLLRDYDDSGHLLPGATGQIIPFTTVTDFDKQIMTDPQGWANFKAYVNDLRGAGK